MVWGDELFVGRFQWGATSWVDTLQGEDTLHQSTATLQGEMSLEDVTGGGNVLCNGNVTWETLMGEQVEGKMVEGSYAAPLDGIAGEDI